MDEMETKLAFRFFLLVLLIFVPSTIKAPSINTVELLVPSSSIESYEQKIRGQWTYLYDVFIDSMKLHEGFVSIPYFCPAGVLTVGYGHVIKETDQFVYPITEQFADSLLKADFDAAIEYVEKTTELKHNQLLAIAHFVFCLGSGNFEDSNLKKLIVNKRPIGKELLRWVNIRTERGSKIPNEFLKRIRTMELEFFKMKT